MSTTREEAFRFGPVLAAAIDIMSASGRKNFGTILDEACAKVGIEREALPKDVENAILISLFRIAAMRGIPGAAEA